jgi:hypothetical protein
LSLSRDIPVYLSSCQRRYRLASRRPAQAISVRTIRLSLNFQPPRFFELINRPMDRFRGHADLIGQARKGRPSEPHGPVLVISDEIGYSECCWSDLALMAEGVDPLHFVTPKSPFVHGHRSHLPKPASDVDRRRRDPIQTSRSADAYLTERPTLIAGGPSPETKSFASVLSPSRK